MLVEAFFFSFRIALEAKCDVAVLPWRGFKTLSRQEREFGFCEMGLSGWLVGWLIG